MERFSGNPRGQFTRHRERGPSEVLVCGYKELADLFGVSVKTVYNLVYKRAFDPGDLGSVIRYKVARDEKRKRGKAL